MTDLQHYPPCYCQPVRGTNALAVLSLIFVFVFAPLGFVFGVAARRQIRRTGEDGWGFATWGMWLSGLILLFGIAAMVLAGFAIGLSPSSR